MILIIAIGVMFGIILYKLMRFIGTIFFIIVVMYACTQLTGCEGQVGVTQNVTNGVRVGDNQLAYIGDSVVADWQNLPPGSINAGEPGDTDATMQSRFTASIVDAIPTPGIVVIIPVGTSLPLVTKMAAEATSQDMRVILGSVIGDDSFNAQLITLAQSQGYLYADFGETIDYNNMNAVLAPLIEEDQR